MKFSEQIFNEFFGVTLGEIDNTVFLYSCYIPVYEESPPDIDNYMDYQEIQYEMEFE